MLAVLDTDLLVAARNEAEANLHAQEASLELLLRGYRKEEIEQAAAKLASARAAHTNAKANYQRVDALARTNAVSRRELDNATATLRESAAAERQAS